MLKSFRSLFDIYKFYKIQPDKRKVVFYAENQNSYPFFEGLINYLINKYNFTVYYVTSSKSDKNLDIRNKNIKTFYIGSGIIRTIFFQLYNSKIMILTMPELNVSYIKKSNFCKNYIYITHNICSIHMVFRRKAFNYYDTFFCVGPHHKRELDETQNVYNTNKINKINFGYNKIDELIKQKNNYKIDSEKKNKTLIIAPSWGKDCIIESLGFELISNIINYDWDIIVRPHPDTIKWFKKKYINLKKRFIKNKNIKFEENISNMNSYYKSDIMISDWSGTAFEFAFGLEKPIIFIDVPKKINNKDYHLYKSTPIEVDIREDIGIVIKTNQIENLINYIEKIYKNRLTYKDKIIKARKETIYNIGNSSEIGGEYIHNYLKSN